VLSLDFHPLRPSPTPGTSTTLSQIPLSTSFQSQPVPPQSSSILCPPHAPEDHPQSSRLMHHDSSTMTHHAMTHRTEPPRRLCQHRLSRRLRARQRPVPMQLVVPLRRARMGATHVGRMGWDQNAVQESPACKFRIPPPSAPAPALIDPHPTNDPTPRS